MADTTTMIVASFEADQRAYCAVKQIAPGVARDMLRFANMPAGTPAEARVPGPHQPGEYDFFMSTLCASLAEEVVGLRERVEALERQEQNGQRAAARERKRAQRAREIAEKEAEAEADDGAS